MHFDSGGVMPIFARVLASGAERDIKGQLKVRPIPVGDCR